MTANVFLETCLQRFEYFQAEPRQQLLFGLNVVHEKNVVWLGDLERRPKRVSLDVKRNHLISPERVEAVSGTRLVTELDFESVF